jgi:hypothetical protein
MLVRAAQTVNKVYKEENLMKSLEVTLLDILQNLENELENPKDMTPLPLERVKWTNLSSSENPYQMSRNLF